MATITFTVEGASGAIVNTITAPQRAKLTQMSGAKRSIQFPYGPQGISYDGMGLEYSNVERPGLKSLLQPTSMKARSVEVTAVLATPQDGGKTSVEGQLSIFEAIANEDVDCSFTYGVVTLPYRVRLTNFSYVAVQRDLDGNITQAEVTLKLDEHIIFSQSIVALKAIEYPPDPAPSKTSKTPTPSKSKEKASTSGGNDDTVSIDVGDYRTVEGGHQP